MASQFVGQPLLDIVRQVQRMRNGENDSNEAWQSFAVFCELLASVVKNKMASSGKNDLEDFEKTFMAKKSITEKTNFIYNHSDIRPIIEFYVNQTQQSRASASSSKCPKKASSLLEQANNHMKDNKVTEAIDKYVEAIKMAPLVVSDESLTSEVQVSGSDKKLANTQIAEAYLSYSKALAVAKKYEKAEANFKMAVALGLDCKTSAGDTTQDKTEAKFLDQIYSRRTINTTNTQLTNASSSLSLSWTKDKGRHVVLNRAIESNEILLIERPFVSWLNPIFWNTNCHHCLKSVAAAHPCYHCSAILFCSNKCRIESWLQYHSHECGHLEVLSQLSKGHLAVRTLLIAGVSKAISLHNQYDDKQYNLECHDNSYSSVYILVDHHDKFNFDTLLESALGAIFMAVLCQRVNIISDHQVAPVMSLILKHLLQIQCNGIQIMNQVIRNPEQLTDGQFRFTIDQDDQSLGLGLYPTLSLLNHSCYNTTKSLFNGNQITFTSVTQLQNSDEVTFNYGPHYKCMSKVERQEILSDTYFFACECKACRDDWSS
ncbi:SET and MYND domain-containing protein 4 [Halotydeus destructor]|nr:SET and MYND domain-containing protein 4 [Halotydeus destructor]